MHERTLLAAALALAIIGVATLAALPQRPQSTIQAHITWTNGTHAWAYTQEPRWVSFTEEYTGPLDTCVIIQGRLQGDSVTSARPWSDASPQYPRCR